MGRLSCLILFLVIVHCNAKLSVVLKTKEARITTRNKYNKRLLYFRGGSISTAIPTSTYTDIGEIPSKAHNLTSTECIKSLGTDSATGLNFEEAASRIKSYGPNKLSEPPKKSFLHLISEQFQDRLVQGLVGVAIISAILASFEDDQHAFVEPLVIFSILFLNAVVRAFCTIP